LTNTVPANNVSGLLGPDTKAYTDRFTDPEANLDIQMLSSFGNGGVTKFWMEDSWMYEFGLDILNTADAPLVNSISYGWTEWDSCEKAILDDNCTKNSLLANASAYVYQSELQFAKLGLLGHTILASSGDNGALGVTNPGCLTGKLAKGPSPLQPSYPGSSSYVLSVGATYVDFDGLLGPELGGVGLEPACDKCFCLYNITRELPCMQPNSGYATGGGFSWYNDRLPHQQTAVTQYLNTNGALPPAPFYNATKRGYPDVSAVGIDGFVVESMASSIGGTSMSCPIWGGLISQLNNLRLNQGRTPLGFVAPLLYQISADVSHAFNDVTQGNNANSEEAEWCYKLGFYSQAGWDPVTGLGTPNFGVIYDYVEKLSQ